jgi:hypothetical protein
MSGGLIVVRAGEGTWGEAYDNLDFFGSFWVKPKRTNPNERQSCRRERESGWTSNCSAAFFVLCSFDRKNSNCQILLIFDNYCHHLQDYK